MARPRSPRIPKKPLTYQGLCDYVPGLDEAVVI